jgi:hypothetical protein
VHEPRRHLERFAGELDTIDLTERGAMFLCPIVEEGARFGYRSAADRTGSANWSSRSSPSCCHSPGPLSGRLTSNQEVYAAENAQSAETEQTIR